MALPSSGQLTMMDISDDSGGEVLPSDGLALMAEGYAFVAAIYNGDSTAPHQISEFYGAQ